MPAAARLLVAAALVVAALAVGALLIGSRQEDGPAPTQGVPTVAPSAAAPSPTPSATALAALTPPPVTPAMAIALEARNRADVAITASKGPLGINDADETG